MFFKNLDEVICVGTQMDKVDNDIID